MPAAAALRLIDSTVLTLSLMEYIFFSSLASAMARLMRAISWALLTVIALSPYCRKCIYMCQYISIYNIERLQLREKFGVSEIWQTQSVKLLYIFPASSPNWVVLGSIGRKQLHGPEHTILVIQFLEHVPVCINIIEPDDGRNLVARILARSPAMVRSEEHTSELQSLS